MKRVLVYVDGEPRTIGWRTHSEAETLEVLGLPPGSRVSLTYARGHFLDFSRGWGFGDGQRFVSDAAPEGVDEPLKSWQQDADHWKTG